MSEKPENTDLVDRVRAAIQRDSCAESLEGFRGRDQSVVGFRPADSEAVSRWNEFVATERERLLPPTRPKKS